MSRPAWLSAGFAVACSLLGFRGVSIGGDQLTGGVICLLAVPLLVLGAVLRERALRRSATPRRVDHRP